MAFSPQARQTSGLVSLSGASGSAGANSVPSQRLQRARSCPIRKVSGAPLAGGSGVAAPVASCAPSRSSALRNAFSGVCARPDIQRSSVFSGTRSRLASAAVPPSASAARASVCV
jgi:hypothetical protein